MKVIVRLFREGLSDVVLKLTFVHARGIVHCRDIVASGKARAIKGVVLGGSDTARESECQSDKIAGRPHF